jgi:hypothetical protein
MGITYFMRPEIPGVQYFQCDKLLASLSVKSCADMWRSATMAGNERLTRCKNCTVGAGHAGEAEASVSPLRGAIVCARCHETGRRLVAKHLCVSCYNRQLEIIKNQNARGVAPSRLAPLNRRSIKYRTADGMVVHTSDLSADITELVVAVLRDSKKQPQFAFLGSTNYLPQLRLL